MICQREQALISHGYRLHRCALWECGFWIRNWLAKNTQTWVFGPAWAERVRILRIIREMQCLPANYGTTSFFFSLLYGRRFGADRRRRVVVKAENRHQDGCNTVISAININISGSFGPIREDGGWRPDLVVSNTDKRTWRPPRIKREV
jgi:hypothetical protein